MAGPKKRKPQRNRAEKVERSIALLETLLKSLADAHVLFDTEWRYLYANDAAIEAIEERSAGA